MKLSDWRKLEAHPPAAWQPELAQLLEEHHLVAWSPGRAPEQTRVREAFVRSFSDYLRGLTDSQLCVINGAAINDVASLRREFLLSFGGGASGLNSAAARESTGDSGGGDLARAIDELVQTLRDRECAAAETAGGVIVVKSGVGGGAPGVSVKRRYIVWTDADVLLKADHVLFGRVVETIAGVSAETEYSDEDVLLVQRVIFVGSGALDVYAEQEHGQFRSWRAGESGWGTRTRVRRPKFLSYRVDGTAA